MDSKKILIVEDEQSTMKALQEKFKEGDYQILEAKNGQEGLEVALREKPDVILLDILMPVVDGCAMLKRLRENAEGIKIPVVIVTNLSFGELLALAFKVDGQIVQKEAAADPKSVAYAISNKEYDYLMKTECRLEDVINKVKSKLEIKRV